MKSLLVSLRMSDEDAPVVVGRLAYQSGLAYLDWDRQIIEKGLQLSPISLPLKEGLHPAPRTPFNGLHGLFADSLPDGWGMLLMDRWLRTQGIDTDKLTPLDRLAYIGHRGMGALVYEPDYGNDLEFLEHPLSLSALASEANSVFQDTSFQGTQAEVTQQLYIAGGSPGGARPKAAIGLNSDGSQASTLLADGSLPNGYTHWLVKFPVGNDSHAKAEGALEYVYSLLAQKAGIHFTETRLLEASGFPSFFACRRFDRDDKQGRIHMHSLAGLIDADFRLPDSDYSTLLKVTAHITRSHQDMVEVFRRMIFNVLAGNRDDHTRNFSFLMNAKGEWSLSPAYDVTFNTGINGQHSMSIAGEGQDISRKAIQRIADMIPLSPVQVDNIIVEVTEAFQEFAQLAHQYSVPAAQIKMIQSYIEKSTPRMQMKS